MDGWRGGVSAVACARVGMAHARTHARLPTHTHPPPTHLRKGEGQCRGGGFLLGRVCRPAAVQRRSARGQLGQHGQHWGVRGAGEGGGGFRARGQLGQHGQGWGEGASPFPPPHTHTHAPPPAPPPPPHHPRCCCCLLTRAAAKVHLHEVRPHGLEVYNAQLPARARGEGGGGTGGRGVSAARRAPRRLLRVITAPAAAAGAAAATSSRQQEQQQQPSPFLPPPMFKRTA